MNRVGDLLEAVETLSILFMRFRIRGEGPPFNAYPLSILFMRFPIQPSGVGMPIGVDFQFSL